MHEKLEEWLDLIATLTNVKLGEGRDIFRWNLHTDGLFTIRSVYLHMESTCPFPSQIDLETKIFTQDQDFLLVPSKMCHSHKRQYSEEEPEG